MNDLVLANTKIRQDQSGRFSLNDLHRAGGGEQRHQPRYWLTNQQTQDLISELGDSGIPLSVQKGGAGQGTYVAKELVYAYAMWISPRFHLQVIRAYDALVTQNVDPMVALRDPAKMRALLLDYSQKVLELEHQVQGQAEKVDAYDRLSDAKGTVGLREAAKVIGVPEKRFVAWLCENGWLFRSSDNSRLQAYAKRLSDGFMVHVTTSIQTSDDREKLVMSVRITPRGLTKLAAAILVAEGHTPPSRPLVH